MRTQTPRLYRLGARATGYPAQALGSKFQMRSRDQGRSALPFPLTANIVKFS